MNIQIAIPDYDGCGLKLDWEPNSKIYVLINREKEVVSIGGNREGLTSLARHLLTIAQGNVPSGYHIHFDDQNSLEEGSCELIIGRM